MKIEAAVLRAVGHPPAIEEVELDPPVEGEVLVEMRASGVCHSDWHVVTGDSVVDLPVVLGHEGSGVVAALGPGVSGLSIGDHVTLSWLPFCERCRACRHGRTNLCRTYLQPLWAGTMLDGTRRLSDKAGERLHHLSAISTWATKSVVPAISCIKMPDVPFEISALIGCGVTTGLGAVLNKAKVVPGSTVVVYGAGGVGLSIVMGAAFAGARKIIVVDRNAAKRDLAISLGATDFVEADEAVTRILDLTDGRGADFAFDAVGHTGIETQLIDVLDQFGTAVLVGLPKSGATFEVDPARLIRDEKVITGSIFGSAHTPTDFVRYAELYAQGKLPIDRLITGRYQLQDVGQACADMLSGDGGRGVLVF